MKGTTLKGISTTDFEQKVRERAKQLAAAKAFPPAWATPVVREILIQRQIENARKELERS